MSTLQAVFNNYDVEPGDTIFVDTGTYDTGTNTVITGGDGGNASIAVQIIGSTNYAAGGSILEPIGALDGHAGLRISGATNVLIRHLQSRSWDVGFRVDGGSDACELIQCRAQSNNVVGVLLADVGSSALLQNSMVIRPATNGITVAAGSLAVASCTILMQGGAGILMEGGELSLSNSIVLARSGSEACIAIDGGTYTGNNNNLAHDADVPVGYVAGTGSIATLADWQEATGQDADSLCHDPLFADENSGDVHLQSLTGRFDPAVGLFVVDPAHSPSIDAGSAASAYFNEPVPNGTRINQGAYGNTVEASKSRTNSALLAISFCDGGTAQGTIALKWLVAGPAALGTVHLEYSPDNGHTWELIAENVPASAGQVQWDTFLHQPGGMGIWRIISDTEPVVMDESFATFTVASGPHISALDPAGLYLQWYGQSGYLYRVLAPTGDLVGAWAPCTNLTFTNGNMFSVATGANHNIVVIDPNVSSSVRSFYDIERSDP